MGRWGLRREGHAGIGTVSGKHALVFAEKSPEELSLETSCW